MQGGRGTFGPGRIRATIVLGILTVVAAAGAATGSTPTEVVTAPVRFFFPSVGDSEPAAPAVTTSTAPPCEPQASLRQRAAGVLIMGMPSVTQASQSLG